jgi:uncharacterized protein (TIGR02118 family)
MSARLIAIHKKPADPAAYDKHYFDIHVPLALKLPGLEKYEVSKGPVTTGTAESDFHLVATLHFADVDAVEKALASPAGLAAVADLPKFSEPGYIQLVVFESIDVAVPDVTD